MRILKLIPALLMFIVLGCQQEIDPNIITDPNPGNGNGNGNPAETYQPLKTGSWWKFKDSATGNITTMTATAVTKTFNNIVYKALVSGASNTDTVYQAAPTPNYYYSAKGASPNSGAPYDITFHYLNDTASVGYNWQSTAGQGNGFTALTKTTIMEKGISVTVQGQTYTNVIHTQLELSYNIFGIITPFAIYDYYLSKGVGIVRVRADISAFGTSMQTCSDLAEYHLEP